MAAALFPDREPWQGEDWSASGRVPELPQERVERPPHGEYAPPATQRRPG